MLKPIELAEQIWKDWWPTRRPETMMDVARVIEEARKEFRAEVREAISLAITRVAIDIPRTQLIDWRWIEARRLFAKQLVESSPFADPLEEKQTPLDPATIERVRYFLRSIKINGELEKLSGNSLPAASIGAVQEMFDKAFPPAEEPKS